MSPKAKYDFGSEKWTCAYCGQPLVLINRPNLEGTDGWEIDHVDMMEACDLKCPMVMCSYSNYDDAVAAITMRRENYGEIHRTIKTFYVKENGEIETSRLKYYDST